MTATRCAKLADNGAVLNVNFVGGIQQAMNVLESDDILHSIVTDKHATISMVMFMHTSSVHKCRLLLRLTSSCICVSVAHTVVYTVIRYNVQVDERPVCQGFCVQKSVFSHEENWRRTYLHKGPIRRSALEPKHGKLRFIFRSSGEKKTSRCMVIGSDGRVQRAAVRHEIPDSPRS
jgi:hypothetical protein